jgi:RNA-binding protein 5/10
MPALYAHSEPRKVKIDFSQPINNDYSSSVVHVKPGSDGMRDIGSAGGGNRVLLLRGLNFHSTGEDLVHRLGQEIARMVGKQGREHEAESAICRVALVIDRETRSKWGFAFIELATTEVSMSSV